MNTELQLVNIRRHMDPTYEADNFESCFLGVIERAGQPLVLVYDRERAVRLLMSRDGMTREEAEEYMNFNVTGAWIGFGTPAFLERCSMEEARRRMTDGLT